MWSITEFYLQYYDMVEWWAERSPLFFARRTFVAYHMKVRNPPTMQETQETWVQSLCQENPRKKVMETESSILAQKIPGTEEPGRLQSMESQTVGHN